MLHDFDGGAHSSKDQSSDPGNLKISDLDIILLHDGTHRAGLRSQDVLLWAIVASPALQVSDLVEDCIAPLRRSRCP